MRGHQGRERGTRHPYHVITMAGAVAAWLEAMGVAEASWEAFVVWLDRMPPDVLREWGRRYSAQQRGTIARMRERRRQYVERAAPPELGVAALRALCPTLWQHLVAGADGEQESDDDMEPLGQVQEASTDALYELPSKYMEATDQDAIDPQTPRALVDVFRRTVLAQFVTGTLRVAPALYEASDFDEQWDVASDDEDAWLEGV